MSGQDFNRYRTLQPCVQGAIHFAHAACSEQRLDLVRPESCARDQCHRPWRLYLRNPIVFECRIDPGDFAFHSLAMLYVGDWISKVLDSEVFLLLVLVLKEKPL